ncbi:ABC transporter ATP-binding protein [Cellulomonas hominis]
MSHPATSANMQDQHTAPAALELSDIAIVFPRPPDAPLTIVSGFTLQIRPGSMHCLAGRSGSGKTSLLRVAVALLAPTAGTVAWAGAPVHELTADQLSTARRTHMGYVDQGATVIGELNVLDNVLLPAVPTGISTATQQRALELLTLFGLGHHARHSARNLSGGERQRVAIARALLLSPTTLAVDEPTASLDRAGADSVIQALREATRHGCAVLAASHDPALIAAADTTTHLD